MRVVIDPTSLETTASVLRSAADALGELCPQVAHAVDGVYAPAGVLAHAESVAASAASTIHAVLYELLDEAADLERRAGCCCGGESTSLPVSALIGVAFGGAALSGASQVQLGSAISPVAAFGPGVPATAVSPFAAAGPGIPIAAPAAVAPVASPAPMSLHQALASGTFGGGSPVGSGISMVWNPSATLSMTPGPGIGSWVPSDNPPAVAGVASSVPLYGSRMDTVLGHLGTQNLSFDAMTNIRHAQHATISPVWMG